MRFIDSAKGSASTGAPKIVTYDCDTPKSLAIGVSCAVAISPPVAVMTNIANITQNAGERSISNGVASWTCSDAAPRADAARVTVYFASGALRNQLTRNTTVPC